MSHWAPMPHAADVGAYMWQGAVWCIDCTGTAWCGLPLMFMPVDVVEAILSERAMGLGIDRADERSFDGDDFPKVISVSNIGETEHCDNCEGCIGHYAPDCDR